MTAGEGGAEDVRHATTAAEQERPTVEAAEPAAGAEHELRQAPGSAGLEGSLEAPQGATFEQIQALTQPARVGGRRGGKAEKDMGPKASQVVEGKGDAEGGTPPRKRGRARVRVVMKMKDGEPKYWKAGYTQKLFDEMKQAKESGEESKWPYATVDDVLFYGECLGYADKSRHIVVEMYENGSAEPTTKTEKYWFTPKFTQDHVRRVDGKPWPQDWAALGVGPQKK